MIVDVEEDVEQVSFSALLFAVMLRVDFMAFS